MSIGHTLEAVTCRLTDQLSDIIYIVIMLLIRTYYKLENQNNVHN